jgi:hypothetical protein
MSLQKPLEGPRRKIIRAQEHLEELKRVFETFQALHPYSMIRESYPEEGFNRYRIEARFPPPPEIGILVGELSYQLLSALDHAVWELANRGGKPPPWGTSFPIFLERKRYHRKDADETPAKRSGLWKVRGLSLRVQHEIELFQPYHKTADPSAHPLWNLQTLRNIDAHQSLSLMVGGVQYPLLDGGVKARPGSLDDGDIFAEVPIHLNPEVNFEPHISIPITFPIGKAAGGKGMPVIEEMYDHVKVEVMPSLTRLYLQGH